MGFFNHPTPKLPVVEDPSTLSPAERRIYNSMADSMNGFHEHFRHTWTMLKNATEPNAIAAAPPNAPKMSANAIVNTASSFIRHLENHHGIEEMWVFPAYAERMPAFRAMVAAEAREDAKNGHPPPAEKIVREEGEPVTAGPEEPLALTEDEEEIATVLLEQHKQIHRGMEKLQAYLRDVKSGEKDFRRSEVWDRMKGWEKVLWTHLDQEVKELGWENMCKYWTIDEIRAFPH